MAITKAKLSYVDGITSSTAELNLLSGLSGVVEATADDGSSIIPSGNTSQRDVSPVAGYLRFNTEDASFEGYDGSAWGAIGGGGINNQKLDDISSGFNSSDTSFSLAVSSVAVEPGSVNNVLISLNGVIQEPTTTYTISGSTITFTTAPDSGDTFFGLYYGSLSINVPADGSVGTDQLTSANIAFDTSTLFIDSTNNMVGVGTITPTEQLDVQLNAIVNESGTANKGLFVGPSGYAGSFVYKSTGDAEIAPRSGKDLIFAASTDGTELVRIKGTSGNVGIGTSSPETTLEVKSTGSSIAGLNTHVLLSDETAMATNVGGGILFEGNYTTGGDDAVFAGIKSLKENGTSGNYAGALAFYSRADGSLPAERMRIDSSGNLLVGTTDSNPVANNVDSGVQLGDGRIRVSRVDRAVLELNRKTSDGGILELRKDGATVGSIGADGGDAYIGTGDTAIIFSDGNDAIVPFSTTAVNFRGSVIDLGYSTYPFKDLYLSGGMYVGGTGSANYLDDYEEGNWSPGVDTGTLSTGAQSTYIKIGRIVHCQCKITNFSDTTSSNSFAITNLPFTFFSSDRAAISTNVLSTNVSNTNLKDLNGYLEPGNKLRLYASVTGGGYYALRYSDLLSSSSTLYIGFSYFTDS